jgi:hypothetical protein
MAISVSVSDQVQDGYLAAGRGIAEGLSAFAQTRTQAMEALSRDPDPAVSGPAKDRLKRVAGISPREERDYLTQSMEGLAQTGIVSIQDLDKFHGSNLQGQRAIYAQAVTAADLGLQEQAASKENDLQLDYHRRLNDLELQHKEAAYRANEASQGRIGSAADDRERKKAERALMEDRRAVQMLIDQVYAQAKKEGIRVDPFSVGQAKKMAPEDAQRWLLQELEQGRQKTQGGGQVPMVTEIPGYGAIIRDPLTQERVSSSQIIRPGTVGGATEPQQSASDAMSGAGAAGATPAPPPVSATKLLIFGN